MVLAFCLITLFLIIIVHYPVVFSAHQNCFIFQSLKEHPCTSSCILFFFMQVYFTCLSSLLKWHLSKLYILQAYITVSVFSCIFGSLSKPIAYILICLCVSACIICVVIGWFTHVHSHYHLIVEVVVNVNEVSDSCCHFCCVTHSYVPFAYVPHSFVFTWLDSLLSFLWRSSLCLYR